MEENNKAISSSSNRYFRLPSIFVILDQSWSIFALIQIDALELGVFVLLKVLVICEVVSQIGLNTRMHLY